MAESFYDFYCLEVEKNEKLEKELKQVKAHNLSLSNRIKYLEDNQNDIIEKAVEKATHALKEEIIELKRQIEQLRTALNNGSTNSRLPTTMIPLDKEKRILSFTLYKLERLHILINRESFSFFLFI